MSADPDRRLALVLVAEWLDARGSVYLAIDLARHMKSRGHSVLLLHTGGPRLGELHELGIRTIRYRPGPLHLGSPLRRPDLDAIREFEPDLVHALSLAAAPPAVDLARRLEIPFVLTVHGWPKDRTAPLEFAPAPPAAVIAISQAVRESLVNRGRVPWDRVHVVEGAVDVRRIEETPPPVEKPHAPVVGAIGTFEAWRGQVHFLDAAPAILAAHPRAHLVIAGDGPEERPLRQRTRELGLEERILFVCRLSSYLPVFAEVDVFVSPALEEGLGQNVLLAMASGKPVVATAVGGVYRLVEDGKTGLMVRPRDPAALAGAVDRLLADRALANAMGRAGRRAVEERYSLTRMGEETEQIYEGVLGGQ